MTSWGAKHRGALELARTGVTRGLAAVALLGLYFVIARTFPTAEAGRFYAFITLASVGTPVLLIGLNQYLVRTVPTLGSRGAAALELRAAFRLQVPISGALALIALIGAAVGAIRLGDALAVVAVVLVTPAFSLFGFWQQGLRRFGSSILILGIANYALIALAVYVSHVAHLFGGDARLRIGVTLLAGSAANLLLAVVLSRSVFSRSPATLSASPLSGGWRYLGSGLSVYWVVSLLVVANNWLPQLLFYVTGSHRQYAYFSLSQNLANVVGFFVIVSNFYLAPHVSALYHEGRHADLSALYVRTTKVMCALCLPVVFVLMVGARPILGLFGHDYRAGAPILMIVTLVQFVNVATGSSNTVLMMTGNQRLVARAMLIALSVGVVALVPAIWMGRAIGYALVLALILILQNLLTFREMQRAVGVDLSALWPWRRMPIEPVQGAGQG